MTHDRDPADLTDPRGAYERFVVANGDALLRLAYALCGDRHLAHDLVQEALLKVHRSGRSRPGEVDDLLAYVRRVVVTTYVSWRRPRRWTERPTEPLPDRPHTDADLPARGAVWAALAELPRRQRAALVLRYYEDLDDERIAAALGCRQATVRSLVSRGLGTLRGRPDLALLEIES